MGFVCGAGAGTSSAGEERGNLALELLRSLDGEPEPGACEAWDAEIDRRAAEVTAGTANTIC
jgi:Putative addiction module component